jgi:hypothetical protein
MTDPKRLYTDFKKFNMKLRYKYGHYEYIACAEPQGRGAWHLHIIMIFDKKAPYIPVLELVDTWAQGTNVTVAKLDDIDNIGAYLTAYLGDISLDEATEKGISAEGKIKEVEIVADNGEKIKKKYIKGGRLHLYPPKFNIYRCSRGVNKPVIEYLTTAEAQKKVSADTLTYKKTIKIYDDDTEFTNHIDYEYYNSKRSESQQKLYDKEVQTL